MPKVFKRSDLTHPGCGALSAKARPNLQQQAPRPQVQADDASAHGTLPQELRGRGRGNQRPGMSSQSLCCWASLVVLIVLTR